MTQHVGRVVVSFELLRSALALKGRILAVASTPPSELPALEIVIEHPDIPPTETGAKIPQIEVMQSIEITYRIVK